jgi:hypothetical protein
MKHFQRMLGVVRERTPFLRHDGVRLIAATAVVGAALVGLYSVTAGQPPAPVLDEATLAARLADTQRQEAKALQARRNGTILFVTAEKLCEEHRFDNLTGHTVAIDYVDCEERLAREANAKQEAAKTANMKGMLASFKK